MYQTIPNCSSLGGCSSIQMQTLRWRHNDHDCVSNHQPHHCLLNCLFGRRSKKTSKLRVTGLCAGKSPGTGDFPAQMVSNAENISIWWRHHGTVPAGTRRNNNVFTTSTRRRRRHVDVVKTLSLRHYCIMCPLESGREDTSSQEFVIHIHDIWNFLTIFYERLLWSIWSIWVKKATLL